MSSNVISRAQATELANLAAQTGDLALRAGAPAAVATDSMEAILNAFGVDTYSVDVAYSAVTVSVSMAGKANIISVMHVSEISSEVNYTRLDAIDRVRRSLEQGTASPSLRELTREIDRIANEEKIYTPRMVHYAWAMLSAAVATTMLATPVSAMLSALATLLTVTVVDALDRRDSPVFFKQLIAAFVSTSPIILLYSQQEHLPFDLNTSQAVAAGIVSLLAGMTLVSGVQDVLMGAPITGLSRVLMAGIATGGMIAGIAASIQAATSLGIILPDLSIGTLTVQQLPPQVIAAAVAGGAAAVIGQARPLGILLSAVTATAAFAASAIMISHGISSLAVSLVAGAVAGVIAYLLAKLGNLSITSVVIPALAPLLPGLALYRGMYKIIVTGSPDGATLVASALLSAFALAAGSVLGAWLAAQVPSWKNMRLSTTVFTKAKTPAR